jgi:hypothetical protein
MPLLTTQSAKSYGWGTLAKSLAGDFESIATYTVGTALNTVTFSSIPATYSNLQMRIFARTSGQGNSAFWTYFNNDLTNANYAYHAMGGDGTSFTQSSIVRPDLGAVRDNAWATCVQDFVDYTNTSNKKVRRATASVMGTTDGSVFYYGGAWNNTAAINRIDIRPESSSANFITGSVFALYGLKG